MKAKEKVDLSLYHYPILSLSPELLELFFLVPTSKGTQCSHLAYVHLNQVRADSLSIGMNMVFSIQSSKIENSLQSSTECKYQQQLPNMGHSTSSYSAFEKKQIISSFEKEPSKNLELNPILIGQVKSYRIEYFLRFTGYPLLSLRRNVPWNFSLRIWCGPSFKAKGQETRNIFHPLQQHKSFLDKSRWWIPLP